MPKRLEWKELDGLGKRPWHTATDASGTVYKIRPVYYRKGAFAGYRITAGNERIRGFKTTLHDAKVSAQRFANRKSALTVKAVKNNGMRKLEFDGERIEISKPSVPMRMLDLD